MRKGGIFIVKCFRSKILITKAQGDLTDKFYLNNSIFKESTWKWNIEISQ